MRHSWHWQMNSNVETIIIEWWLRRCKSSKSENNIAHPALQRVSCAVVPSCTLTAHCTPCVTHMLFAVCQVGDQPVAADQRYTARSSVIHWADEQDTGHHSSTDIANHCGYRLVSCRAFRQINCDHCCRFLLLVLIRAPFFLLGSFLF